MQTPIIRSMMAISLSFILFSAAALAEKPFGTPAAVNYSQALWSVLQSEKMTGPNSIRSVPYKGQAPHGKILETTYQKITVNGHTGQVIVKKNYGGQDITRSRVVNNPKKYLKAITVMFKREAGYDPDNKDWFWVKYKPDGSLHKNPKGMLLAGRVAKGMPQGCIACHRGASGGDYLFNNSASQLDR